MFNCLKFLLSWRRAGAQRADEGLLKVLGKHSQHATQQLLTLTFNDMVITVTKKPIKNINLRIDRHGMVKVSAPIRCSLRRINAFLTEKEAWITAHVTKIKAQPKQMPVLMQTGASSFYLGKPYLFQVHTSHQRPYIQLEENHIACFMPPNASEDEKRVLLQHWYRSQMQSLLPALITKWQPIIGVQVNEWGVRAMTSRWGSCNTLKKRIWLNLNLMQKPLACLEYVLVHEMVHLLEASHNKRFYALMSQFMPEWMACKRLLNGMEPCSN